MNIENGSHSWSASESVDGYFVREMTMVHRMFRREFLLAPGMVRRVEAGDTGRVHSVTAHLRFISAILHQHHSSEDGYVWPLLRQRAPLQVDEYVAAVIQQHRQVDEVQTQVDSQLSGWSRGASVESGERLAAALERLTEELIEHMNYEEQHVVPLMQTHIGLEEWNQIVQTMTIGQDRKRNDTLLVLGMTMYEGDDEIIDKIVERMPSNLRAGIRGTAALAYAEHAQLMHGTASPPRSTEIRR